MTKGSVRRHEHVLLLLTVTEDITDMSLLVSLSPNSPASSQDRGEQATLIPPSLGLMCSSAAQFTRLHWIMRS